MSYEKDIFAASYMLIFSYELWWKYDNRYVCVARNAGDAESSYRYG